MSSPERKRQRVEEGTSREGPTKTSPQTNVCDWNTQKFCEIVQCPAFVDKTEFIKALLESKYGVIVALAPRRFGKSTNMNMLQEFLTGNKKLFQDKKLKITDDENFFNMHCRKNPVIYASFKTINVTSFDNFLDDLKGLLHDVFNKHRYLIEEIDGKYSWSDPKLLKVLGSVAKYENYWENFKNLSEREVQVGFKFLSHVLNVYHGKRVYVLIDEFDTPIMRMIVNKSGMTSEDIEKAIDFIGYIMSETFKDNEYLKRGLINACVRIAEVLSGDANNIVYYKFLGDATFAPYFGFTETEVESLLEKKEFDCCKHVKKDVKDWYNGYTSTVFTEAIYNCSSISRYLNESLKIAKPCFDDYWSASGNIDYLKDLFGHFVIFQFITNLIDGEKIEIKAIKNFSKEIIIALKNLIYNPLKSVTISQGYLFLQFLTENGYLNAVSSNLDEGKITIRIPNKEIRRLLQEKCYDIEMFETKYELTEENIKGYLAALDSVLTREDKNAFIEYAKAVSKLFDGAQKLENEAELRCILFVLAYNVKIYRAHSELSIHSLKKPVGRPPHLDLLVVSKEAGLIVELKFHSQETSEVAFSQIESRQYYKAFDKYEQVKKQIWMGLHMTKEGQVSLTYNIDRSPPETITNLSPLEPVRNDPPAEPVVEDPPAETVSQEY